MIESQITPELFAHFDNRARTLRSKAYIGAVRRLFGLGIRTPAVSLDETSPVNSNLPMSRIGDGHKTAA